MRIDPANRTAQLHYRAAGNPPSSQPHSAISNCFPGLEFDFRNIWRRMFEEIELHEADNYVLSGSGDYAHLAGRRLLLVEDVPTIVELSGPQSPGGPSVTLTPRGNPDGVWTMEWSNAMTAVLRANEGRRVTGHFTADPAPTPVGLPRRADGSVDLSKLEAAELTVRPLFGSGPETGARLAAIDPDRVLPGELTQSLCSPWQNDYRECACYYWAASRPDYVNVEVTASGASTGNMWLAKHREPKRYVLDDRSDSRLLSYQDLFRDWQGQLRFIVGGDDHD